MLSPHGPMPFPRFAWNSSITRVFQSATSYPNALEDCAIPLPAAERSACGPSPLQGSNLRPNSSPRRSNVSDSDPLLDHAPLLPRRGNRELQRREKKRGASESPRPRWANLWWRRRESNPRPGAARAQRLRVCLRDWVSRPGAPLSRIVRSPARWHSPLPSRARPSASSRLVASIPDRRRSRMDVRGYLGRVSVLIGIGSYVPPRSFTRTRATSTRCFASACPVETVRPH